MSINQRFFLAFVLIVLSALYIVPWKNYNVNNAFLNREYTLGLDLQGGVELDYKVDFSQIDTATTDPNKIVEGLKNIIDKRVNSLGLAEPNIQTARYGSDVHIIVQIPTKAYTDLTPEEQTERRALDIKNAKETIGKVVQIEFREQKTTATEEDYTARKTIADNAHTELATTPFATVADKYTSQYERVIAKSGTGTLPPEAEIPGLDLVTDFPYLSPVTTVQVNPTYTVDESGQAVIRTNTGYSVVLINNQMGSGQYEYSYITVDATPSGWIPAQTEDGRVLNDRYLVNAGVSLNNVGQPQVDLLFNDEGKNIFAELTRRLLNKQIAIFVGGEMLTAPVVQSVIPDGRAVITGQSSIKEAQELADNINTGIVPAPIYLTSERTIDAKIGGEALNQILIAGLVGLAVIVVFLTVFYRVGGLLAGITLVAYTLFLIAIIKLTGVVLTLASIAGVILSIGLAIDANILIFERVREVLRDGVPLAKAIRLGFEQSWTAIWDSHVTSLVSALILYIFGIAMIKGFGLMLGLGIVLSLFTAMWVSRVLIQYLAQYIKNPSILIGYKK